MTDSIMTLRPDVVVTVLEDSAVLLELQTKYFYSVNKTGWAIVQMLESGVTMKQVNNRCTEWGAPPAEVEKIEAFINIFTGDNLVAVDKGACDTPDISFEGPWITPLVEKHQEPLQRVMVSAFDPSLPLAE